MGKHLIADVFRSSYNYDNWKSLLIMLFPNANFYNTPIESVDKSLAKHSIVKSIIEFGSAKLVDSKLIRFYDVVLEDGESVNKNRVGLRNLIHTELNPGDTDALFAVYHVKNEPDWRLTFISKSIYWDKDFIEHVNITHPKRFTYVLGVNETVKTAISQFNSLIEKKIDLKSLISAFSVEKLNREFFTLYKTQYEKFFQYLASQDNYRNILLDRNKISNDDQEKPIRDFTKKLLGRIVFLYFLQKKGWMGCQAGLTSWENGDKQFLLNLFLNFQDKPSFLSSCLNELFFNTLNQRSEIFKFTGTRVPYLNGGLFEPDEPKASKTIDFPASYFEKLFDFFSEYNFTIDENSPDDHEVGIDPEMLGHIFENLLDDNKGNGTFYTPKEIVQYMTQESLIQYLETHLGKNEAIGLFIRYGQKGDEKIRHNFIRDNAKKIEELLDDVKICDPAIGSGAFPMGMLHEIFKAKLSLDWTLDRVEVKKNIIQKSIYGVDLDSGAIDIARLRFWLALIVDEDEPHPLPNLDFKIMQGNSLLEKFEGIDLSKIHEGQLYNVEVKDPQIDMFSGRSKKKVSQSLNFERIEDLMNLYYNANTPEDKKNLHQRIDKHVLDHIHFTLEEHKSELIKESKKYIKNINTKITVLKTAEQKIAYQNESKDAKNLKGLNLRLDQINQKEIELFRLSQSSDRPFFLWHLFFKEVFDHGGFDILIGNPPYINANALKKMYGSEKYDELKSGYETAKGTIDIYILFYELGINILKDNGVLSYINPNRYLSASYGEELRRFIYKTSQLVSLADYSSINVFKEASTYPVVTILQKHISEQTNPIVIRHFNSLGKMNLEREVPSSDLTYLPGYIWGYLLNEKINITKLIIEESEPISNVGLINATSTAKEADDYHYLLNENQLGKKVINTGTIDRYTSTWGTRKMIDKGEEYLQPCLDISNPKISRNRRELYATPKIIIAKIAIRTEAFFDKYGDYASVNTNCIHSFNPEYLPEYVLCWINSKLYQFLFESFFDGLRMSGGFLLYSAPNILNTNIKRIPITKQEIFVNLSEILTVLINAKGYSKEKDSLFEHVALFFDDVIDGCIYELFFKCHMKDRNLDILDFVQEYIPSIQKISPEDRLDAIMNNYQKLRKSEINTRLKLFVVKSPDILKPIIQG
jgi:hypothetical protein